jgi:hypothetical protein
VTVHSSRTKRHDAQTAKQHTPEAPPVQEAPPAAAAEEFDPSRATLQAVKVDPERVEVHPAAAQAGPRASTPRAAAPRESVLAVLASSGGKCPKGLYLVDDGCVACEDYRQPSDCKGCKPPEQCRKYITLHIWQHLAAHAQAQQDVLAGTGHSAAACMLSQADGPAGGPESQQQQQQQRHVCSGGRS